jgi:hypothetical protein
MQVWLLQYLIRDFKKSDSAIIDAHDTEVFKLRLVQNDGWEAIRKFYLEQTSSHLIGSSSPLS